LSHRFYCPDLVEAGTATLADTEFHHLVHVLRHKVDEVVELFNGDGLFATCRIGTIRKRDVELEIVSSQRSPLPQKEVTLATAVPKGDRFDWLIEKATELGVRRVVPITTSRSVVDPRSSKLDKLRQTVITACKQSGRNHLMAISEVTSWRDFLEEFSAGHQILVAHPEGGLIDSIFPQAISFIPPIVATIGPEGGFSEDEIQASIEAGAKAIQLGKNILRIETAAIAVAARLLL